MLCGCKVPENTMFWFSKNADIVPKDTTDDIVVVEDEAVITRSINRTTAKKVLEDHLEKKLRIFTPEFRVLWSSVREDKSQLAKSQAIFASCLSSSKELVRSINAEMDRTLKFTTAVPATAVPITAVPATAVPITAIPRCYGSFGVPTKTSGDSSSDESPSDDEDETLFERYVCEASKPRSPLKGVIYNDLYDCGYASGDRRHQKCESWTSEEGWGRHLERETWATPEEGWSSDYGSYVCDSLDDGMDAKTMICFGSEQTSDDESTTSADMRTKTIEEFVADQSVADQSVADQSVGESTEKMLPKTTYSVVYRPPTPRWIPHSDATYESTTYDAGTGVTTTPIDSSRGTVPIFSINSALQHAKFRGFLA
jgi:hypothetical protein